jgi:DNA-binding XRE family transcriptional regulator
MVINEGNGKRISYTQDEIDALAYSYVLTHGYEGALAMFGHLAEGSSRDPNGCDDLLTLSRQIVDAINDEAATIFRLLDRMIAGLQNGARHPMAAVEAPGSNLIDRHVGRRVRQLRSELGLSLACVAEELSLTPHALTLIERGAARLCPLALKRLAERLGVNEAYFFRNAPSDEGVGFVDKG